MEGTIKWYDPEKRFGFIVGEDGKEYFVHKSELPEGVVPTEGQAVSFEVVQAEQGTQAKGVQML
ncbi:cold-shock protein [Nanoarchaeota archaeon]